MTTEPSYPESPYPESPSRASRPSNHRQPSPDELRRQLRRQLDRDGASDVKRPAITLVGFRRGQADVLRLDADQPEDALLEFVLPVTYQALGVVASSVVATTPYRNHRNGALAIGVSRRGDIVSMLATDLDIVETREPQGWLIDACLRAVGLPTAPCDISPLAFPIALWLDRLMVAILNAPTSTPIMWHDAVALCPVPRRWRSVDAVDLGVTMASTTTSWKSLRAATAGGGRSPVEMTAARAAWMDDAMFARWCMGAFPDMASLRGDVEFLAPSKVAEQVEVTLRAAWSAFVR